MSNSMNRRSFLSKAALGTTALVAATLTGCSTASGASDAGKSTDAITWDHEADMVLVGSGTGVFGAVEALRNGKSVIILEKAGSIGGTTIMSGGNTMWVPRNHKLGTGDLGADFSEEEVLEYLRKADVYGDTTDDQKLDYIRNAPKVFENVEKDWGYQFVANSGKGDFYELPFHQDDRRRCMQWKNLDGDGPLPAIDLWEKIYKPELEKGGAKILLETEVTELILDDAGAVIGVKAKTASGEIKVHAKTGVLMAAGGFDRNENMCRRFLRTPIHGSMVVKTNTGDAIKMGMTIGADLECMTQTHGGMAYVPKDATERDRTTLWTWGPFAPYSMIVNKRGRRFANESHCYGTMKEVFSAYDMKTFAFANIPGFVIFSEGFKELGKPWPMGKEEKPDFVESFDTLDALAEHYGIDAVALKDEVARFNTFCETGVDEDFGRGAGVYENNNVAANDLKNRCLGKITAPYHVARLTTSSLGTRGGLRVNTDFQVLHVNGNPIKGLYASGTSATNPLGGAYPGAGSSIGPGSYGAYRAVNHMFELKKI
ncbi:FAD-binding protein [Desulfitobacterium sp. THU1]|uniref:FAD-binding protein n=1 Tax=Desulfitobacterium sp. THU1 TaxID=3138072 RepID=UPI00311E2552